MDRLGFNVNLGRQVFVDNEETGHQKKIDVRGAGAGRVQVWRCRVHGFIHHTLDSDISAVQGDTEGDLPVGAKCVNIRHEKLTVG